MNQKENLDHDACTTLSDFAENYQYVIQERFQSFHWNNSQGSIHPAARYYRDMSIYYKNVSNILQEKSFKFTSKDLKHDTAFLYEVISIFCKYVKQNYQSLKIVEHFLMLVQSSIKI